MEAYGFDTYIFRLLTDGSGQIIGGTSYQRTAGGEKEFSTITMQSVSGRYDIASSFERGKKTLVLYNKKQKEIESKSQEQTMLL